MHVPHESGCSGQEYSKATPVVVDGEVRIVATVMCGNCHAGNSMVFNAREAFQAQYGAETPADAQADDPRV